MPDEQPRDRRVAPGSRKAREHVKSLRRHREQLDADIRGAEAVGGRPAAWKVNVRSALDWLLELAEDLGRDAEPGEEV